MAKTRYEDRNDTVEEKLRLLRLAREAGNYDLALSLAASIRETLWFERQRRGNVAEPDSNAGMFAKVGELPKPWARWATGWSYYKVLAIDETVAQARTQEPVDVSIGFRAEQTNDLRREVRVARVDPTGGTLREVPVQVYEEAWQEGAARLGERRCRLIFLADAPAHGRATYLVFYGNPYAELPDYQTDLQVRGKGFGLDVENQHFVAHLSHQMGQLDRLTYKASGLELFAGGDSHGEPPNVDWGHDYRSDFQKYRIRNWDTCPNFEIVKGPLCIQVHRWGFPHSPAHPLFTPSRMQISVTYKFYAGLPYFIKQGSLEAAKPFDFIYLRDDEWIFSGFPFTDTANSDKRDTVGLFNRDTRDAFIALYLEHRAQNFDGKLNASYPASLKMGTSRVLQGWSRWAASGNVHFEPGTRLFQKNVYFLGSYPKQGGPKMIEQLRHRLSNPLSVSVSELPADVKPAARGTLARTGETLHTAPLKQAIWNALGEVQDQQLYTADTNIRDMGYVYDVRVRGGHVRVLFTMPNRGRPMSGWFGKPIRVRLQKLKGVQDCTVTFTWEPAWMMARMNAAARRAIGLPL